MADPAQFRAQGLLPFVFLAVLWLFHVCAPLSLVPALAEHRADRHEEDLDTEGVRYDQARRRRWGSQQRRRRKSR